MTWLSWVRVVVAPLLYCLLSLIVDKGCALITGKLMRWLKPIPFPFLFLRIVLIKWEEANISPKIDLFKGYWEVPLTDRVKEIPAFVIQDALFSCKVMPFGIKNSAATFQRLMNKVRTSLTNCIAYIDDVIVYSDTWEEHFKHLRALFARLVQANLVISLNKCEFAKATVTCLEHVVGEWRVLPRQGNVQAILDFPLKSSNKRELMRFIGMSGFYQKFCANYCTLVAPLTNLLKRT